MCSGLQLLEMHLVVSKSSIKFDMADNIDFSSLTAFRSLVLWHNFNKTSISE